MAAVTWSNLLVVLLCLAGCARAQFNFRTKDLKIEKSGPCAEEATNAIRMSNYTNQHLSRNLFVMNTDINVGRNLLGSLSFQMKIQKCTIDLTRCDYYDTYKFDDICERLVQKNAMWSDYMGRIRPALTCPISAGDYRMVNGTFDYTLASRLPIDGNRWLTAMKMYETTLEAGGRMKRQQVWCLDNDVRITLSKNTRPRKRI